MTIQWKDRSKDDELLVDRCNIKEKYPEFVGKAGNKVYYIGMP